MAKIHNQPSEVVAHDGTVQVDGPDGVAVTLTPTAALTTADRLERAALEALVTGAYAPPKLPDD